MPPNFTVHGSDLGKSVAANSPLSKISEALTALGLSLRGGFQPNSTDALPPLPHARAAATVLLVGNAGPHMWRAFSNSTQAQDGAPHPLNRWTRQHLDAIANTVGGMALYPFDATPAWPFQHWAARCEPVHPSPLGLFIHPEYGLWHAYRAAIVLAEPIEWPAPTPVASPCQTCADRPCLSRCPVAAFSASGYDVPTCARHLQSTAGADCLQSGCLARRACPVGADYQQLPAQNAFHMRAFLKAVTATSSLLDSTG